MGQGSWYAVALKGSETFYSLLTLTNIYDCQYVCDKYINADGQEKWRHSTMLHMQAFPIPPPPSTTYVLPYSTADPECLFIMMIKIDTSHYSSLQFVTFWVNTDAFNIHLMLIPSLNDVQYTSLGLM